MNDNFITDEIKWKFALKNSNLGMWDWNAKTKQVFYSKESKKILGFDENETMNTEEQWNERVHPEDRELYFKNFQDHAEGKTDFYKNEHRILCKDGNYKWILDCGKIVQKDKDGNPLRIIGTHKDISERKIYEEKLRQSLTLISSQNKRLHNFTHIVSHNLRTHIGNFDSILHLYDDAESKDEKEEMLTHLKSISNSLTETIKDLSEIISIKSKSAIEELNIPINLRDCIEKVIESLELEVQSNEANIQIQVPNDIFIIGNLSYLESILHNLISNGIKYKQKDSEPQITIKAYNSSDCTEITITDNGIGIDLNKYEDQLFGMYQTFHGTKRDDSKGVGLYLVKNQVEALNGTINIESTLGTGTTFTLSFKK